MLTAAVVCLLMLAAGLIAVHWLPGFNREHVTLSASGAALRGGERMSVPWPEGTIDINHDDAEKLDALHGVGPVIAGRIVEERQTNGLFLYPEDLLNVNGIGPKTFQKLWEQILLAKPDNQ